MDIEFSYRKYQSSDDIKYKHLTKKGLDEKIVKTISELKEEPEWMTDIRLKAYRIFRQKPMPKWGADLSEIDFDDIHYYASPTDEKADVWEDVPEEIKKTFDRIGVPEAERKFLGGATAQYDSEVVYHHLKKEWEEQGVVFLFGLARHPSPLQANGDRRSVGLTAALVNHGGFNRGFRQMG